MSNKESKKPIRWTGPKGVAPFSEKERWFDDYLRDPFSLSRFSHLTPAVITEIIPSIDVYVDKNDVVVKAELPGIRKEDIDITLTQDSITISGEKRKEEKIEKKNYYRWECSYGFFSRVLALPSEVQTDKVKTQFKDGVLEIRIPKTEEAIKKEKKVKIE
jgi:HSP20 family protein